MAQSKRKSKVQLEAELIRARKIAEGRAASKKKKKVEKKPTRCRVMSCRCVAASRIRIKQPGVARAAAIVWWTDMPVHLRTGGAEYQDRKLGIGMRFHNPRFAGKGTHKSLVGWICTVCGEEKGE